MNHRMTFVALALLGACAPQTKPIVSADDGQAVTAKPQQPSAPGSANPSAMASVPDAAPDVNDHGGMPTTPYATAPDADVAALASANNAFAADLYGQLRLRSGNFAASPASIALAFGMTYAGAEGRTAQQLRDALHVTIDDNRLHRAYGTLLRRWNREEKRPYELRVANRLFGEQSLEFKPPFLAVTGDHYAAEVEEMDFLGQSGSARQRINGWVADQTQKRIQNLIPAGAVTPTTRLVLANAIYFKGKWATQFAKPATAPAAFHTSSGVQQTPMMHLTSDFSYGQVDGVQLLEMGYEGGDLAMTVLLPDARDGLADLETKITAESLERWYGSMAGRKVVVSLPRFTIDPPGSVSLNHTMKKLGVADAFIAGKANFLGMSKEARSQGLHITDAVHKAFVEVNEEGTEAAAATAVVVSADRGALPRAPVVFTADHPFVFVIRDVTSGSILFMGRVAEPASA